MWRLSCKAIVTRGERGYDFPLKRVEARVAEVSDGDIGVEFLWSKSFLARKWV